MRKEGKEISGVSIGGEPHRLYSSKYFLFQICCVWDLVSNERINNRPVEPRWRSTIGCRHHPAFHAWLLSFNPFGIRSIWSVHVRSLRDLISLSSRDFEQLSIVCARILPCKLIGSRKHKDIVYESQRDSSINNPGWNPGLPSIRYLNPEGVEQENLCDGFWFWESVHTTIKVRLWTI